jgi:hypothetical protein
VGQCAGTTKSGDRCRRAAAQGSDYCAIHQDQELRQRSPRPETVWDTDSIVKAAVGFGLVAAIFLFRFRK